MFGVRAVPTVFTNPCTETMCYVHALPISTHLIHNRIERVVIIRNVYLHFLKLLKYVTREGAKRHVVFIPHFEKKFRLFCYTQEVMGQLE
jgi:hypothetical protein